jgi:hypothetical protein
MIWRRWSLGKVPFLLVVGGTSGWSSFVTGKEGGGNWSSTLEKTVYAVRFAWMRMEY